MDHVLITGGAGYVGSLLTPQLLAMGYKVTVYDTLFFGDDFLPKSHPHLSIIEGDIRDVAHLSSALNGVDTVISLACISNDASFVLDESLSTSINLDAFEPMVIAAKKAGVKRFIYASSSSVYGVSDKLNVTEDHPLVPLTLYNKYKGMCEPLLFKHMDENFTCVTIRPATLCGYGPRLRLDLSVNILTNHAVNNNKIIVFGGEQLRPNLHIQDMCDLYTLLLTVPKEKIAGEIFNAGYENMSIKDIAMVVKRVVEDEFPEKASLKIEVTESNDNRSYHINSDKIKRILGFEPKLTVEDAVRDLCHAFRDGKIADSMTDDKYYNVKRIQALEVA
ncbi:MAG: NAD-dependent epimerase/dehydratase family protein [Gammaproteobacteria bacterium]|jgi:nucleoside-diphosphate-sugar epimerase|nr:NAD-dependent epimerase/dehydratase family protein [Gammaproteobacteria bacterium]